MGCALRTDGDQEGEENKDKKTGETEETSGKRKAGDARKETRAGETGLGKSVRSAEKYRDCLFHFQLMALHLIKTKRESKTICFLEIAEIQTTSLENENKPLPGTQQTVLVSEGYIPFRKFSQSSWGSSILF